MLYLVIGIVLLGVLAGVMELISQRRNGYEEPIRVQAGDCSTCTGSDPACEQVCMMEAATKNIVYFEDEELDNYRGRPSDSYTVDETEQFAEVLETLRPTEVKEWNRSLILRGINMPDGIKDEYFALVSSAGEA